jgi:uroporphyrinogen decarboxylase
VTKRERIGAALALAPVDRTPIAFWRHVPEVDHRARGLAEAMLAFHRRWDLDLIKVMSSGVYCVEDWGCKVAYQGAPSGAKQCVEHAVKTSADWARIRPLDPGAGALGRELEAVRLIARGRDDDAPVLHTIFSPLTIARKLAGECLLDDLRTRPAAVLPALEAIAATVERYALTALEAGADGLFFATQTASPETVSEAESAEYDLAYARRALEAVRGRSTLTLLHLHGATPYWHAWSALPVHAVNWHDRLTTPTLAGARAGSALGLVGGLDEQRTLRKAAPEAVAAEVADAIRQADGGLIVAPGCVLPLDVPDSALAAATAAARRSPK